MQGPTANHMILIFNKCKWKREKQCKSQACKIRQNIWLPTIAQHTFLSRHVDYPQNIRKAITIFDTKSNFFHSFGISKHINKGENKNERMCDKCTHPNLGEKYLWTSFFSRNSIKRIDSTIQKLYPSSLTTTMNFLHWFTLVLRGANS